MGFLKEKERKVAAGKDRNSPFEGFLHQSFCLIFLLYYRSSLLVHNFSVWLAPTCLLSAVFGWAAVRLLCAVGPLSAAKTFILKNLINKENKLSWAIWFICIVLISFFLCLKKKENKIAIVVTNLGLEQRILWDKKKEMSAPSSNELLNSKCNSKRVFIHLSTCAVCGVKCICRTFRMCTRLLLFVTIHDH